MHSFGYLEKKRKEIFFLYKEVYISQYKMQMLYVQYKKEQKKDLITTKSVSFIIKLTIYLIQL
jgi:hypothetical protein